MGRQARSFNVNDLFMPGQNSVEAISLLVRSPLIGSIVSAYNRSGGRIRVGAINTVVDSYVSKVLLVTTKGVPAAEISSNSAYDDIYFNTSSGNSLARHASGWRRLNTTNPKYLQNKLSPKSTHEAAESFDMSLTEAEAWFGHELRGMIDRLVDKAIGEGVTRAPLFGGSGLGGGVDSFLLTTMARVFAGEISMHEVSADHRMEFEQLFNLYTKKREKFYAAMDTAVEFLTGDKWIFANNINGGVIVGAINDVGLLASIEKYRAGEPLPTQQLDQFNYVHETVPLQWYPTFESVPDDIRTGIEFSLAMLKAHRNADTMLPTHSDIWQEMGCAAIANMGGASVYVLAK